MRRDDSAWEKRAARATRGAEAVGHAQRGPRAALGRDEEPRPTCRATDRGPAESTSSGRPAWRPPRTAWRSMRAEGRRRRAVPTASGPRSGAGWRSSSADILWRLTGKSFDATRRARSWQKLVGRQPGRQLRVRLLVRAAQARAGAARSAGCGQVTRTSRSSGFASNRTASRSSSTSRARWPRRPAAEYRRRERRAAHRPRQARARAKCLDSARPDDSLFNIITFSSGRRGPGRTVISAADEEKIAEGSQGLDTDAGLGASGGTNLYGSLDLGGLRRTRTSTRSSSSPTASRPPEKITDPRGHPRGRGVTVGTRTGVS